MTVTREQAQLLTTLAIACRPHRAPTWDPAGVMAAIAKIRDWQLSEVALRVIVAAADREAKTPAVIEKQEIPAIKPPLFKPSPWDPDAVCSTCSRPEERCRSVRHADDDHPFVSRARNAQETTRPSEAVARILNDLRERTTPPATQDDRPTTQENRTCHVKSAASQPTPGTGSSA